MLLVSILLLPLFQILIIYYFIDYNMTARQLKKYKFRSFICIILNFFNTLRLFINYNFIKQGYQFILEFNLIYGYKIILSVNSIGVFTTVFISIFLLRLYVFFWNRVEYLGYSFKYYSIMILFLLFIVYFIVFFNLISY